MNNEVNKSRRPKGSQGMTSGASVESGLSHNRQITGSHSSLGMGSGQGGRPKSVPHETYTHGNKKFTTK